jgi:3-deoxy-D-manno-octulosonic-acid transferase
LLAIDPKLLLILAPRHPERFGAVASLLEKQGIGWIKRSAWKSIPQNAIQPIEPGQVILLDTIGELASIYSLAAAAFIGGSLIPAGGHNPLEPAQFGVPIVIGPNYANFRAITDDLRAHDAIRIASKEELAGALIDLLRDKHGAAAMGARAKRVFDQQAGATARTVQALEEILAREGSRV